MLSEECAIGTDETAILAANDVCGFGVQQTHFVLFFGTCLFHYGGFVFLWGLDWFLEQVEQLMINFESFGCEFAELDPLLVYRALYITGDILTAVGRHVSHML